LAVELVKSEFGVGLGFTDVKRGKPYYVDFLSVSWRTRFQKGLPKNHIFRRALGAHSEPLKVVDATAGFGQDSMMILSMGFEVTAVERSKEVMSVLEDGIERARREDVGMKKALEKLKIVLADTREYLAGLKPEEKPDVVYLDPMFDKPKKKAKSPKEMQLLQELLGTPPAAEEELQLFEAAFKAAKKRVVVKRPIKARALKPSPAHSYKGQSVRYDVYVKT
jgi:16S rRNA (guanine1516-N2)-methyltransferase